MNTSFFKTVLKMFGFGEKKSPHIKGEYTKPKQKAARRGSMNVEMKEERERHHGTMSRRIARNIVKDINSLNKREKREHDRKRNPNERKLRFAS